MIDRKIQSLDRKLEKKIEGFIIIILLCLQSMPAPIPQCGHKVYSTLLGTMEDREREEEGRREMDLCPKEPMFLLIY